MLAVAQAPALADVGRQRLARQGRRRPSSLVVAVGIGGSLAGYRFLEPLAAALVGFMILRMGALLAYEGAARTHRHRGEPDEVAKIHETLSATGGVIDVRRKRTRRMAHRVLVDAHVPVDPRISVSEGHRIARLARAQVRSGFPDVLDVLVHPWIARKTWPDTGGRGLPGRPSLVARWPRSSAPGCPRRRPPCCTTWATGSRPRCSCPSTGAPTGRGSTPASSACRPAGGLRRPTGGASNCWVGLHHSGAFISAWHRFGAMHFAAVRRRTLWHNELFSFACWHVFCFAGFAGLNCRLLKTFSTAQQLHPVRSVI